MKISELIHSVSLFVTFLVLFLFSFFLNYISALYSDVNLFKIDLVKRRKGEMKFKKLIFILKNGNLLFATICFYQVFLNIFISDLFMERMGGKILEEFDKTDYRFLMILGLSLLIAFFNEIFARYLANRASSQKKIFNNFLITVTYSLIRIPYYFFRSIIQPRKKIFANSEQDIIRFINNLTTDNILEKNEAKLVQAALKFDELKAFSIVTPWKKVVALDYDMSYSEIQAIHSRHFFTRYPILNKRKEIIGIFNVELFYWKLIKNKEVKWQNYVDKGIVVFDSDEKLDKILTKLKNTSSRLAVVQEKKKILGIITLQDVLGALVGKIRDEREILLLPRHLDEFPGS
ncbi:MAG: Inosine-5'-monophosphate dehydrogenase [Mycoplasmataceae bacterium]|nr:MAG: Inosine-5'-monophosphate dehydrogenase [Mycoplasmataceae bacterium]